MWQDLRYSVRVLVRNPAFTAVALLVLGLGIGVNTAIFSLINAVIFRPLPVHAPKELRYIHSVNPHNSTPGHLGGVGYRSIVYIRETSDAFADVTATAGDRARIRAAGEIVASKGEMVATNYFDVLGVKPLLGRTFIAAEDEDSAAPPVIVISYGFWKSRFAADPGILGTSIQLDRERSRGQYGPSRSYTIVGVTSPAFNGTLSPWESVKLSPRCCGPIATPSGSTSPSASQIRSIHHDGSR